VSGVAPRRMPTERSHGFQLREPKAAAAITSVTVNGQTLERINPPPAGAAGGDGAVGWFVQPAGDGPSGLSRVPVGSLVVLTHKMSLSQQVAVHLITSKGQR
jgi:hypothetical protein